MGEFLHKYNTDNVHTRAVIVGLINLLNSKIQYENVLSDLVVETIGVPFFPNMGGDERFLQDFFLHWSDCQHPRMADGNYDVIPRGVVTLTGNTINTTAMTHRFVRGTYVREVNGELQRFNSFLNSIPLTVSFDLEVETDTVIEAFKIQQAILETFYKVQIFSVSFKGFRVPCQAGFSEDLGLDKTFTFTYQEENKIKFKFSIEVETYYPVTDQTTTRIDSNRMSQFGGSNDIDFLGQKDPNKENWGQTKLVINRTNPSAGIGLNLYPLKEKNQPPYTIELTSPTREDTFFSSGILPLMWKSTGVVNLVNIYYKLEEDNDWRPIINRIKNTGFYEWKIPFFDQAGNEENTDYISSEVISASGIDARIRAIVDVDGGIDKIVIFERGVAYNNSDLIQVSPVSLPFNDPPSYTEPTIQANVNEEGSLIDATIIERGAGFNESITTKILIKIEDSFNSSNNDVLSKRGVFFGSIDSNSLSEKNFITNINPTAYELDQQGYLFVGAEITGDGLPANTIVEEINIPNNTLKLNNDVTDTMSEASFTLEKVNAIIKIR
jgi:hypothetical protein